MISSTASRGSDSDAAYGLDPHRATATEIRADACSGSGDPAASRPGGIHSRAGRRAPSAALPCDRTCTVPSTDCKVAHPAVTANGLRCAACPARAARSPAHPRLRSPQGRSTACALAPHDVVPVPASVVKLAAGPECRTGRATAWSAQPGSRRRADQRELRQVDCAPNAPPALPR